MIRLRSVRAFALCGVIAAVLPAQASVTEARWWADPVEAAVERAGQNAGQLRAFLQRTREAHREGAAFLVEHMPVSDLRSLPAELLLENVVLAYEALAKAPWGSRVPRQVFLNDVLPYAVVNEAREAWRKDFVARFGPVVAQCRSPGEAAQLLNRTIFKELGVRYSTKRRRADQSPSESIASGMASCTGLSILLIDACRAVGVPARLAGIASWVNKRGNHSWVEVWDDGWHFTGAAEPDRRGLDHAWFTADAALARKGERRHAIHAVSYQPTGVSFPLVWAPSVDWVHAVDVSDRYAGDGAVAAGQTRLLIRVVDGRSGDRLAAEVRLVDVADTERVFEGESKDESHDRNDLLTLTVPAGRSYDISVKLDGEERLRVRRLLSVEPEQLLQLTVPDPEDQAVKDAFGAFFAADGRARESWAFDPDLEDMLLGDEPRVRQLAWAAYRSASIHAELRADHQARRVRAGELESPYVLRAVGERPKKGWPLVIAMHGGGGVPKQVNDGQWRVMQRYYRDQPGNGGYLYLALRAPNDEWNGFYAPYVWPVISRLVRQLLVGEDVDPDRVYLIGYSHGGYGAFGIGMAMPDHFAAVHASAAAPTPGLGAAENLRNTPFTFMIGEKDTAYGRIERCRAFAARILELKGDDPVSFPVEMEYQPGLGHGGLPDRDKIRDLYAHRRNAAPRRLTWRTTDDVVRNFYWLGLPEPGPGKSVDARCQANRIEIQTHGVGRLSVGLDARLVDLSLSVRIVVDGKVWERRLQPRMQTLGQSLLDRGDPGRAYTCHLEIVDGKVHRDR